MAGGGTDCRKLQGRSNDVGPDLSRAVRRLCWMLNYASSAAEKWSSLRTTVYTGSFRQVVGHIPEFERRPTANQNLDIVVRPPVPIIRETTSRGRLV